MDMHANAPEALTCPGCGASLAWVTANDLRRVRFAWRCLPGQEPKTYELRCVDCKRLVIVYERGSGLALVRDQSRALGTVRNAEREDFEDADE